MSFLKSLKQDTSKIKGESDDIGGALDSNLYKGVIETAYLNIAASEAVGVVMNIKLENGRNFRTTQWVQSGKAKGSLTYYTNRDGQQVSLPGFIVANAMSKLSVGKELHELDEPEEKIVGIYSPKESKEIPTAVPMLMELKDMPVVLGITKQIEDQTTFSEATKKYEPNGKTREINEVDKVFQADTMLTTTELAAGLEEGEHHAKWLKRHEGKTRDKSTKLAAGAGVQTGRPGASGGSSTTPAKSLFGKK